MEKRPGGGRGSTRKERQEAIKAKGILLQRVMWAAFGIGLFTSLLLLIAISTDFWVTVTFETSERRYEESRGGEFYKTGHYHGLWRICRQEFTIINNSTNETQSRLYCRTMYFFEQPVNVSFGVYDHEIMHYRRSSASIGLIGLVLSIVANTFTWYSMAQLRYMFKRLAATIHLIAAACCWVTVEVFKRSMDYEMEHLQMIIPKGSKINYGFSYGMTWVCIIFFIVTAVAVFACSSKRKGQRALSVKEARENEPVVLGRV